MIPVANQTDGEDADWGATIPIHFLFPDDKSPKFVYRPPDEDDPKYKEALEYLKNPMTNLTASFPLPKDLEKRLVEAWKKEYLDYGKDKKSSS